MSLPSNTIKAQDFEELQKGNNELTLSLQNLFLEPTTSTIIHVDNVVLNSHLAIASNLLRNWAGFTESMAPEHGIVGLPGSVHFQRSCFKYSSSHNQTYSQELWAILLLMYRYQHSQLAVYTNLSSVTSTVVHLIPYQISLREAVSLVVGFTCPLWILSSNSLFSLMHLLSMLSFPIFFPDIKIITHGYSIRNISFVVSLSKTLLNLPRNCRH